MYTNLTVNWRGKEKKRGLTETAIELLRKTDHHEDADHLLQQYNAMLSAKNEPDKGYSFANELELVSHFVRVRF